MKPPNLLAVVVPRSYRRNMSRVVDTSANLCSATRRGLRTARRWERKNGCLTVQELAEADSILDRVSVGQHS